MAKEKKKEEKADTKTDLGIPRRDKVPADYPRHQRYWYYGGA